MSCCGGFPKPGPVRVHDVAYDLALLGPRIEGEFPYSAGCWGNNHKRLAPASYGDGPLTCLDLIKDRKALRLELGYVYQSFCCHGPVLVTLEFRTDNIANDFDSARPAASE